MTAPLTAMVRSAMCALYPSIEGLPGIEQTDLDAYLERYRREASPTMWAGVCASSLLFHVSPVMTTGIPLPAFLLSRPLRDRHAHKLATTDLYLVRQSTFLLKLAAGLCWGADEEIRARMAMAPYPEDPDTFRTE